MVKIYVLIDPITNNVMYVGKTIRPLLIRLKQHIYLSKLNKTKKDIWINKLKVINSKPLILQIEEVEENMWQKREIYWIEFYRKVNLQLTNISKGGEGFVVESKKKCVFQYDLNYNFIKKWNSLREAADNLGISVSSISNAAIINCRKKTANKYYWSYENILKRPLEKKISEIYLSETEDPLKKIKECLTFLEKTRSKLKKRIHTESKANVNLITLIDYTKELNINKIIINFKEGDADLICEMGNMGKIFKNRRKELKLTTNSFPGTDSTTISRFENSKAIPFYYKIIIYCKILKIRNLTINIK